ncbi:hypothetical protein [Pseudorhodoplanes sp.]|uniref:hypothetical protein n=1 Tax=Pseudorhodoplanes sp. TaxID=1934341 RepID=UPI00391CB33B
MPTEVFLTVLSPIFARWRLRWLQWRYNRRATLAAIEPFFDLDWYLSGNADVKAAGVDPLVHYVEFGCREGRDPHPLFDTAWYLSTYHDAGPSGLNPLVHYLHVGAQQGYDHSPLFDTRWYARQNPDARGWNPLLHFIRCGNAQGRDPHPLFRSRTYASSNPRVQAAGPPGVIELLSNAAQDGWRVIGVDQGFAPLLALCMRHKNGAEDAWFFDQERRRLPEDLSGWPVDALGILDLRRPTAREIWHGVVCAVRPQLTETARTITTNSALFRYADLLLSNCLRRWADELALTPREIDVTGIAGTVPIGDHILRADLVRELLTTDDKASLHVERALTSGEFTCRSPVDGRILKNEGSLVLTSQLFAYRFVDETHSLVFYLISPVLGWAQVCALYLPSERAIIFAPGWDGLAIQRLFGTPVHLLVARHALSHAADIEQYLQTPQPRANALVFVHHNIAHHLWNDLGELDRLSSLRSQTPEIILLDGARNE